MSLHPLLDLLARPKKIVVGLMSGTSLDGVDATVVEISGFGLQAQANLLTFQTFPYANPLREHLLAAAQNQATTADVSCLSFAVGQAFAQAARQAMASVAPLPIDLIGSHGQTIWHDPPAWSARPGHVASTLQIGEPAVIAAYTQVVTVADFRPADVALGGQGAPLVPYADWALFRQPGRRLLLQNIGGISNITLLGDTALDTLAFDNGPGNILIDAWVKQITKGSQSFDQDGSLSAQGRVLDDLLAQLLTDPYLHQQPPKSTGREYYNLSLLNQWNLQSFAPWDVLATLVAFTAAAIAKSVADFIAPTGAVDELVVAGGGAHNKTLMAEIAKRIAPIPVRVFSAGNISADAKEAVAFALFAVNTIHNQPSSLPQVTGAHRPAVLGKICLP